MESITEGVNHVNITDSSFNKKNRIQISNSKKTLFFYVNLAKIFSTLFCTSTAIATVVTITGILKDNGLSVKIMTSTVDLREESGMRPVQKAKIEILLGKSDKFDGLMAATNEEGAAEFS